MQPATPRFASHIYIAPPQDKADWPVMKELEDQVLDAVIEGQAVSNNGVYANDRSGKPLAYEVQTARNHPETDGIFVKMASKQGLASIVIPDTLVDQLGWKNVLKKVEAFLGHSIDEKVSVRGRG